MAHDCQKDAYLEPGQNYYQNNHFILRLNAAPPRVFSVKETEVPLVRDIMTPVVYSVARKTPASTVVDALLSLGVHRLFVTDEEGEIVGVCPAGPAPTL